MDNRNESGLSKQNLVLLLVGVVLLFLLMGQRSPVYYGNGYGHMVFGGFSVQGLLVGLIGLVIKLLWILVVVGIVGGIYQLVKQNFPDGLDFNSITGCLPKTGKPCSKCGVNVKEDFNFCPNCKESLQQVKKETENVKKGG